MRYPKLLALSIVVLLATTACDPPGDALRCQDHPFPNMCGQSYHYSSASISSTFDAADFTVDMSSSNIDVTTTSGYATVIVDLSDGTTQSNSFQWMKLGDEAVVANPSAVNAWVQPKLASIDEVDVEFDFQVSEVGGTNVVVTELEHQGTTITGSSDSWYVNGGGCDGETSCIEQ